MAQLSQEVGRTPTPGSDFFRPIKQGLIFFALAVGLVGALFALYSVRWIVLLFGIGIALGVIIYPLFEYLREKTHLPKAVFAVLFLVLFFGTTAGVFLGLAQLVAGYLAPMLAKLPLYLEQAKAALLGWTSSIPALHSAVENFSLTNSFSFDPSKILTGIQQTGYVLFGLLFTITIAIYLSLNETRYMNSFLKLFPAYSRDRVATILSKMATVLRGWMVAQLFLMLIIGVMTALAMRLIGLENWLLFGLISGILEVIPYLGPLVSAAVILVVTIATHPEKAIWVILAFGAIQQIENYVIVPLVMRNRIELPPIYLLALMLILGSWFGAIGVLVAPALLAVIRTLVLMTYIDRMDRQKAPGTVGQELAKSQ